MVMIDKHYLGLPLLEGSLWRSPRIPPNFIIETISGREHDFLSKIEQHTAPSTPSQIRHSSFETAKTSSPQPSQGRLLSLDTQSKHELSIYQPLELQTPIDDALPSQGSFLSLGAPSTKAISVSQPLDADDFLIHETSWLEPNYVLSVISILLVCVFFGMLLKGDRSEAPKDPERWFPEPFPGSSLTDDRNFQNFWNSILGEQGINEMQEAVKEETGLKEKGQEEKRQEKNWKEEETRSEEECGLEENNGQKDMVKEIGTDAAVHRINSKSNGNEAAKEAGKEDGEGDAKAGIEEDKWIDVPDNAKTGSNGSPVMGKKRMDRQNAKKRAAAKKAATGEEWEDEPEVRDTLAMTKDKGQDEATAQVPKIAGKGKASLPPHPPARQAKKEPLVPTYAILREPSTVVDYTKKKNFELEALLKARSQPHTGKKAILIARLQKSDVENFEDGSDWEDDGAIVESTNNAAMIAGGSDQFKKATLTPKQVMKIDPSKIDVLTNASKVAEVDKRKSNTAIPRPSRQRSSLQNVPTVSGSFTGSGQSSVDATNTRPDHQRSILQNAPTASGPFTGFGHLKTDPDAPLMFQGPMFRRKTSLPAPAPLDIKGQSGEILIQDAVSAAMKQATGDKKEGKKPTTGFRGSFLPKPKR